jgi:hypothetical protein
MHVGFDGASNNVLIENPINRNTGRHDLANREGQESLKEVSASPGYEMAGN